VRSQVTAIIVGTGTILADDPQLTARDGQGRLLPVQPERVVVGHRAVPDQAAVRGPGGALRHLATHDLHEVLDVLAASGHRRVLVEGGPRLATAFLAAGLVDELHCYVAPLLLGRGLPAVADLGIETVAEARRWRITETHHLDPDLLVIAQPEKEKLCLPE
jgi:diaminohydroxyphosphoribosylaminopyrimidine deaminase/5-amino-6-(5-phosphoribosylamino)uracil reductase